MDRNFCVRLQLLLTMVALRKESVDRNYQANAVDQILPGSLSARRAWIEIVYPGTWTGSILESLSARRAWIEITTYLDTSSMDDVALRKESVDRNSEGGGFFCVRLRRSPQGERG